MFDKWVNIMISRPYAFSLLLINSIYTPRKPTACADQATVEADYFITKRLISHVKSKKNFLNPDDFMRSMTVESESSEKFLFP